MPPIQFHETRMGAYFLERTMPEMVKQLTRIADALERAGARQPPEASQSEASVPSADEDSPEAPKSP